MIDLSLEMNTFITQAQNCLSLQWNLNIILSEVLYFVSWHLDSGLIVLGSDTPLLLSAVQNQPAASCLHSQQSTGEAAAIFPLCF